MRAASWPSGRSWSSRVSRPLALTASGAQSISIRSRSKAPPLSRQADSASAGRRNRSSVPGPRRGSDRRIQPARPAAIRPSVSKPAGRGIHRRGTAASGSRPGRISARSSDSKRGEGVSRPSPPRRTRPSAARLSKLRVGGRHPGPRPDPGRRTDAQDPTGARAVTSAAQSAPLGARTGPVGHMRRDSPRSRPVE